MKLSPPAKWRASCAAVILLSGGMVFLMGSTIVFDPKRKVTSVAIVGDGGGSQQLYRLPGGAFFAVPQLEGVLVIRCLDTSTSRGGYITPHMHSFATVKPGPGCKIV